MVELSGRAWGGARREIDPLGLGMLKHVRRHESKAGCGLQRDRAARGCDGGYGWTRTTDPIMRPLSLINANTPICTSKPYFYGLA